VVSGGGSAASPERADATALPASPAWAGIGEVAPRPGEDLEPLLAWLRTGEPATRRLDFPAGTALPDGRLDLCKQDLGPLGASRVAAALPVLPAMSTFPVAEAPIRHLLLGTDGLGDGGAEAVAEGAGERGVRTLYLGCNAITAAGTCRIANRLRASPQAVRAVWLKRNPLGAGGGAAAAELIESAPLLRTLDLVQTGIGPQQVGEVVDALIASAGTGRAFERLYVGGNRLGDAGALHLARLIEAGAVAELYLSAAGLGDVGALILADALDAAPRGRLRRLSCASNGIGPLAAARLVRAAAVAGVALLDLGRVASAGALGAPDNRLDAASLADVGDALSGHEHQLSYLVLADCGMRSSEALALLGNLSPRAASGTRFVLGKGVAGTVRRRFAALAAGVGAPPTPEDVAAIRSVYRAAAAAEHSADQLE
jgi:Ran GTPase-activating protein (RanGAP) involved in mRNA processing and transport